MSADTPLRSFFMAGFECSSHRRPDGERLDLIAATAHDRLALEDYRSCSDFGLLTIRDGLRWHLIEREDGSYDWSSWVPMLEAAAEAGVQVIWDLFHYGSPDHIDRGSPAFIEAYARFAAEAVRVHRAVTGTAPIVCPINEISYLTWAMRTGYFTPAGPDEPGWLGRHLVSAALAGVRAMRAVEPECRFLWAEPLIHVAGNPGDADHARRAEEKRQSQFHAYDMLTGASAPELGGSPDVIDLLGVNYYSDNQWYFEGSTIPLGHHAYRPLREMLGEWWQRFHRPILIAETGAEGSARASWLHYVCGEVRAAMAERVPVEGICLYPVLDYHGWDNDRVCATGLLSGADTSGRRQTHLPLAEELKAQAIRFTSAETAFRQLSPSLEVAA